MLLRDSVEVDELRYPMLVCGARIVPDSEGAGRFRGAPGGVVEYGPVDTAMTVAYGCDGASEPAQGARGGLRGAGTKDYKRTADGSLSELPPYGLVTLADGERIASISPAGGGYGPPRDRDPELVRRDVVEGLVSLERARDVYGVVV